MSYLTANTLQIVRRNYEYKLKDVAYSYAQTEFLVDGIGIGERFGFESDRPWFGSTCFEMPADACHYHLQALRGLSEPQNQFGTNRFVLYRCHCGCDYCGVLSCEILRTASAVAWRDLHYEGNGDDEPVYPGRIDEFIFEADTYDQALTLYSNDRNPL